MEKQSLKHTIADIIHLTPARQAEACYSVQISDTPDKNILVSLTPSLEHLTWSRIGSKDRKDLYESMVFHTGLALGNLTAWLEQQDINYSVSRSFPTPPLPKAPNAYRILSSNIEFIAYETGTWIELQRINKVGAFDQYQYDSTKCHRDLVFILGALAKDLEYLSNENIRAVLMEYFDRQGNHLVRRSIEICAYQFVKELLREVINLRSPSDLYQAHTKQNLQGPYAESGSAEWSQHLVDIVIQVMDTGLSAIPKLVNGVPRQQDKIEVKVSV